MPTLHTSLVNIAQGDGESERVGRVIRIHDLFIRGFIEKLGHDGSASTDGQRIVRIIVFLDKQNNKTTYTATQMEDLILQETATAGLKTLLSWRNLSQNNRFQILYDRIFTLRELISTNVSATNAGADYTGGAAVPFHLYKKFAKPIRVTFEPNTTSGADSTIESNNIGILSMADNATVGNGRAYLTYRTRVRYTD